MMNNNVKQPVKQMEENTVLPNENINTENINTENINKSVLDLDKEIPNYTQNILNHVNEQNYDLQGKIEEAKQIAGAFISDKWNEFKELMQQWSIGYNDVPTEQSLQQTQVGQQGGKKRTRVKRKRKHKKTKHNRK